jgi:hypothetical protein
MTGYEAAVQEQHDAVVRRWRERLQVQEDDDFRQAYRQEAVTRIIERHSQVDQPPPPSLCPASPTSPSPFNSSSSSSSNSESLNESRPRRGVQRSRKLVDNSQTAKEVAVAKGGKGKGKGPTRRKLGKKALAAAAEMSQLLDDYVPPPSSAALLNN